MMNNFPACGSWILLREGGFVNNPFDAGRATNHGITIGTLSAWRGNRCTIADVQNLTGDAALPIYKARYWSKMSCDQLPLGVDLSVFDAGVMSGPSRGIEFLQGALGVFQDGDFGPVTIAAVQAADPVALINQIAEQREDYYDALARTNPNDHEFLRGWDNRVELTRCRALEMANG